MWRRRFSLSHGLSSHRFDVFANIDDIPRAQFAQQCLAALGLLYGEVYGEGHYGELNVAVFFQLLRCYRPRSFREFALKLNSRNAFAGAGVPLKLFDDAQHVRGVINRLASVSVLNGPGAAGGAEGIDLGRLFREPGFAYFHLPTIAMPGMAKNVANLVLTSLAAHAHRKPQGADVQVLVAIDEFAEMSQSANIAQYLRQTRSMGVSMFLGLQSLASLRHPKMPDLEDTVKVCAGLKHVLGADEITAKWLQFLGGEASFALGNWERRPGLLSPATDLYRDGAVDPDPDADPIKFTEQVRPAIDQNLINEINARKDAGFIVTTFDAGVAQRLSRPCPVVSDWPVDLEAHRQLDRTPWPAAGDGAVPVAELPVDPPAARRGQAETLSASPDSPPAAPASNVRSVLEQHLREGLEPD